MLNEAIASTMTRKCQCLHLVFDMRCTVLEEMGNPFLEHSQDLLVIDTRDIMDTQVADTVRKIETLGKEQYSKFVIERLEQCTTTVTQTIPKNKLPLFSRPPVKIK